MAVLPGKQRELPSLRRIAHCTVAALLHYSGFLTFHCWVQRRVLKRHEVIVLGLHRVLTIEECAASLSEPAMIMLRSTFEQLIDTLRKSYRVIGLEDLETLATNELACPLCMLTFDDAWQDTFDNAYPVLKQQSLPAIVFVPTGLISKPQVFWVERLSRVWNQKPETAQQLAHELSAIVLTTSIRTLNDAIAALKTIPAAQREAFVASAESRSQLPEVLNTTDTFMSWDEVLKSADTMTAASHTVHHMLLTCEAQSDVDRELADSKQELETRLGQRVTAFAYPSGAYNEAVRDAVGRAGYAFAFTTRPGRYRADDDPLTIPRVLLHEGAVTGLTGKFSPAMFHLRLMGWR